MEIRKAGKQDLERILELYHLARIFMKEHGNPDQWGDAYPSRERVEQDLAEGNSYVCVEDGSVDAVFYFRHGEDPDYQHIEQGSWLNDQPYSVMHRVASPVGRKGMAGFCIDWCLRECGGNLKIDTHRDNLPMQRLLEKHGFVRCGIIFTRGEERLAYQKQP